MKIFTDEGTRCVSAYALENGWKFFAFVAGRNDCKRQDILDIIKEKSLTDFYNFGLKAGLLPKMQDTLAGCCEATDLQVSLKKANQELIRCLDHLKNFTAAHSACLWSYDADKSSDLRECALNGLKNVLFTHPGKYAVPYEFPPDKDEMDLLLDALNDIENSGKKGVINARKNEELNLLIFVTGLWDVSIVGLADFVEKKKKIQIYRIGLKCKNLLNVFDMSNKFTPEEAIVLQGAVRSVRSSIIEHGKKLGIEEIVNTFGDCIDDLIFRNPDVDRYDVQNLPWYVVHSLFRKCEKYNELSVPFMELRDYIYNKLNNERREAFASHVMKTMRAIEK